MSTVLWTNLLVNGEVRTDDSDKYSLHKHADKLDAIGRKLGLGSFHDICDTTDVRFNTDDLALPEGMTSTTELMAVQGAWIDLPRAIALLDGLLSNVQQNNVRFGLLRNDHDDVVAELSEALEFAKTGDPSVATFNFSIVT